MPARRGPVQDILDPPADPRSRLSLLMPDRFEHLHDEPNINHFNGQATKDGIHVGCKRRRPLGSVLRVFPSRSMGSDVSFGARLEGHGVRRAELLLFPAGLASGDRILTVEAQLALRGSSLACFGERDIGVRAKPHVAGLTAERKTVDPRLIPARADPQIEPAAIEIHPRLAKGLHGPCRQNSHLRHPPKSLISLSSVFLRLTGCPMFCPMYLARIEANVNVRGCTAVSTPSRKSKQIQVTSGRWRTSTT